MWVKAYHNAEFKEEFGEKPFISLPKQGFCDFMLKPYKKRLWPTIKHYSNFPNPDECENDGKVKAVSS